MSKNERGGFDFRIFSSEELEKRAKAASADARRIKKRLNGPPLKCDGCGVMEADRNRLRLGHDAQGEEIVVCRECGYALYGNNVPTAPFGKVMESDLERAEAFASAAKEELAGRAKLAIERAERERKLEASGFLDRFKKKREEPVTKSGNGTADPESPLSAEPEMEGVPEGETAH